MCWVGVLYLDGKDKSYINKSADIFKKKINLSYPAYPRYPAVGLLVSFCFKRRFSNKELITKDPKTPQVHLFIMGFSLYHLWRQVVQRSTKCGPPKPHLKHINAHADHTESLRNWKIFSSNAPYFNHPQTIPGGRCMNRPAKICNLQLSIGPQ